MTPWQPTFIYQNNMFSFTERENNTIKKLECYMLTSMSFKKENADQTLFFLFYAHCSATFVLSLCR